MARVRGVQTEIPVIFFEEGDKFIAYSPALDLSSCGDSLEQAKRKFAEAVSIFLKEINEMGTLEEVLSECGWHKLSPGRQWAPPIYVGHLQEKVTIPLVN